MNIVNVADLKNPETGLTYRQENNARQHLYAINSLVEPEDEGGVRLFVVEHTRDCDGTPLYNLSYVPAVKIPTKKDYKGDPASNYEELFFRGHDNGFRAGLISSGYSEESLKLISPPTDKLNKPEYYCKTLYDWEHKVPFSEFGVDERTFRLFYNPEDGRHLEVIAAYVSQIGTSTTLYHLLSISTDGKARTEVLRAGSRHEEIVVGEFRKDSTGMTWIFESEDKNVFIEESFKDESESKAYEKVMLTVLNWFWKEVFTD